MTSHDVVARVRRLAGTRKVGHAGTLDPMATGVLVLGVNRATRLLGHLMLTEKAYDATIRLGVATTTDDAEGEVVATARRRRPRRGDRPGGARRVRRRHRAGADRGLRDQGRRQARLRAGPRRRGGRAQGPAGDRPRARRARRRATAERLDVDVSVRCSSGTYIRAIARDLGAALGVGGHLTALRRTAVGPSTSTVARTLDELARRVRAAADRRRRPRPASRRTTSTRRRRSDVRFGRALDLDLPAGLHRGVRPGRRVPGALRAARRAWPGPSPSSS